MYHPRMATARVTHPLLILTIGLGLGACRTPEQDLGNESAGNFWAPLSETDERAEGRYNIPPGQVSQDADLEEED